MTPSDWIAISALVLSFIVTAANLIFNYFTHKQNIRAKRIEIITEKSIEAFQDVTEKITILQNAINEVIKEYNSISKRELLLERTIDLRNSVNKYLLYFPQNLSLGLFVVISDVIEKLSSENSMKIEDITITQSSEQFFYTEIHVLHRLVHHMQKHLGLETEYQDGEFTLEI